MAWHDRRYSPWLLKHEERLRLRQDSLGRLAVLSAIGIAVTEALLPWHELTPHVPVWLHIAVAALALPVLYMLAQADLRRKEQAFALALSDKGRRLLFLDPYLEPEEFAVSEHLQGAHVLPLQRQLDAALKAGAGPSLHGRMESYYRTLPSAVHEGDRLGILSFLHPATFFGWIAALGLAWAAMPGIGAPLPGGTHGVSALILLLPLYMFVTRANTRFGYETALYDWLRLG